MAFYEADEICQRTDFFIKNKKNLKILIVKKYQGKCKYKVKDLYK